MAQGAKSTLPTPINPLKLAFHLNGYNSNLYDYLIKGFIRGFSISSLNVPPSDISMNKNLQSAYLYPQVVTDKLTKEQGQGRISQPFTTPPFPDMVISPLGLQPKKAPGQYRVIHHLSFPKGRSVNDSIQKTDATVKYATVGQAIQHILNFGQGCYLAKTDIKSAFRIIPVSPADYHLLGFSWQGKYYYDKCLPMGCSSSCAIFESFSTGLEWIIQRKLPHVAVLHILDDFLFIAPSYHQCLSALSTFKQLCLEIGVPLAPEKTVGPARSLEFAGIQLDTQRMQASLPPDKISKFMTSITDLQSTKSATLKQIQSLAGMLNFACVVIAPARAFSRRLHDLSIGLSKPYHHRKITTQVRLDLDVWKEFLSHHNTKTFFLDLKFLSQNTLQLYTDASSTIGYGGYFGSKWFAGKWPDTCLGLNIALLEIYPICLAFKLWSSELSNKCIILNSDNMAVVHILNTFTSKDQSILKILRVIVLQCMFHNILIRAKHIPGVNNTCSDLLSRDRVTEALHLYPHLQVQPVIVPQELGLDILLRS